MPRQGRRIGSDATAQQKWAETMSSKAVTMMPERSTVSESVKTSTTLSPTESEIASLAYQLWQDNGCPVGSEKEDWFRAEAMLKNKLLKKGQDLSGGPSVPRDDPRTELEMLIEFRWEGHWVVWESEWGGPRWVWDLATPGFEVLSRAA
jgi:hypothetical protein